MTDLAIGEDTIKVQGQQCLDEFAWHILMTALKACVDTGMGPAESDRLEILRRMKTLTDRLDGNVV